MLLPRRSNVAAQIRRLQSIPRSLENGILKIEYVHANCIAALARPTYFAKAGKSSGGKAPALFNVVTQSQSSNLSSSTSSLCFHLSSIHLRLFQYNSSMSMNLPSLRYLSIVANASSKRALQSLLSAVEDAPLSLRPTSSMKFARSRRNLDCVDVREDMVCQYRFLDLCNLH